MTTVNVPAMLKPKIRANIDESGQHLAGVFPTRLDPPGTPSFMYTIGMHEHGLPDLLCIGNFPPALVGTMLNTMCEMARKKEIELAEGIIEIGWTVPVKVRKCGPSVQGEYTIQAGQFYQTEEYEVLQVMLQDKNGVWHDEGGCEWGKVATP